MRSLSRLFLPEYCVICDTELVDDEDILCEECHAEFPVIQWLSYTDNLMHRVLRAGGDIERAAACFYYRHTSQVHRFVVLLKYLHRPTVADYIFTHFTTRWHDMGFFDDIDAMIPIPLAADRLRQRGYNQAEWICHTISRHYPIPVLTDVLARQHSNATQTHLSATMRMHNVRGIFSLNNPDRLRPLHHILIVDDICTTGATLGEAVRIIQATFPDLLISVFTLGWSGD